MKFYLKSLFQVHIRSLWSFYIQSLYLKFIYVFWSLYMRSVFKVWSCYIWSLSTYFEVCFWSLWSCFSWSPCLKSMKLYFLQHQIPAWPSVSFPACGGKPAWLFPHTALPSTSISFSWRVAALSQVTWHPSCNYLKLHCVFLPRSHQSTMTIYIISCVLLLKILTMNSRLVTLLSYRRAALLSSLVVALRLPSSNTTSHVVYCCLLTLSAWLFTRQDWRTFSTLLTNE